ncbi:MAG: hypothetical protein KF912_15015 [Phycisphaeraceae bacterium]|nr:hypothetical protein [Phycisphaeraceae bacterium]
MRRLDRLEQRRYDQAVRASLAGEIYRRMKDSESVRYTIGAMQPIDPEYTKNTFAQGDRVKSQLQERLRTEADYEYQGSVTTDTHIKARSDIDLLVIRKGWVWLEPSQTPPSPYQGDPAADMRQMRGEAVAALRAAFPQASLDDSVSTALKLSGASLTRVVDVVPASWYDTNEYLRTNDRTYRGIKVFNKITGEFVANTPFLLKRRIEEKDQATRGGFRKAARLMKSLMYDSDGRVDMSSYNIVGIAYNIPSDLLQHQTPRELALLEACFEFCTLIEGNPSARDTLRVPDGSRTVFGSGQGATVAQLRAMTKELADLRHDVLNENVRSFKRLAEARVEYPLISQSGW